MPGNSVLMDARTSSGRVAVTNTNCAWFVFDFGSESFASMTGFTSWLTATPTVRSCGPNVSSTNKKSTSSNTRLWT